MPAPCYRKITDWLSVRDAAKADEPVELLIYEEIGKDWWDGTGLEAKAFAETLQTIPSEQEIIVAINSPGGNVWDGLAIYHLLQARKNRVTIRIDGMAASIASVIAMAGKESRMPTNALMLIHNPFGLAIGDANTMRKAGDDLDKHKEIMVGIYSAKSGQSADSISTLMDAAKPFKGSEAKEMGFVDTVTDAVVMASSATPAALTSRILSRLRPMPAGLTGAYRGSANNPQPTPNMETPAIVPAETVKPPVNPQPPHPTDPEIMAKLTKLEDEHKTEREKRIKAELATICASRPQLDSTVWLPKAMVDPTVLDALRQLPETPVAEPVRSSVTGGGNPLLDEYLKMKPGGPRNEFRMVHHQELREAHRLLGPRAANTISSALMPDYLVDAVVQVVGNKLAPLRAFSLDFSVNPLAKKAIVQVPLATTCGAVQSNPSNFETGDTTLSNIAVTVAQIDRPFHLTNDQLNSGSRMAWLAGINAASFANGISDVVTPLMSQANYGAATAIGAAASFTASDLSPVLALAKNYDLKNLLLDGGHLAYLLPTDKQSFRLGEQGAFGFDLIAEMNRWTGGVANLCGFICAPQAIVCASGVPVEVPVSEFLSVTQANVEQLNLTTMVYVWFARGGRVMWSSYDVMFGAAVGDATAAENLVTS